jgi:ElaB/YqjD/DUF883 family membrane-anchored ribosome-binding protein
MADEKDLVLEEPELIRHQMEETRSSLNEKLEALELKVTSTVENAANSVSETVEAVKESVHSSLHSVRDLLDVRGHVQRHPWPMVGGSLAVGFLVGWYLTKKTPKYTAAPSRPRYGDYAGGEDLSHGYAAAQTAVRNGAGSPRSEPAKDKGPSWLSGVASALAPELDKLKGLAIGTVTSLVRDVVADAIPPQLKPKVTDFMDNVTTKLGGEPIEGNVLEHFTSHTEEEHQPAGSYAATCPGC